MLSVSIKHPDSEAFIDAKMTEGKVTGANVSVKLTDAFMQAAIDGKPFVQQYRHRFVEKNRTQRMEIRRARRTLLGHHIKRVRTRLLRGPGLSYRVDQPLR